MEEQKKVRSIAWEPDNSDFTFIVYRNGTIKNYNTGNFVGCTNKRGYRYISIMQLNGKRKQIYIARIMAMLFLPNPENRKQVNYKNGNRSNCAVSNIEWATSNLYAEKNKKAWRGKGSRFNTHLSDADVRAIRNSMWTAKRLAWKFDVSVATIYLIRNRKTFQWVK